MYHLPLCDGIPATPDHSALVEPYTLVVHESVFLAYCAAPPRMQRRILTELELLKSDPFRLGDFAEPDATGRLNQVLLIDEILLTYWTDHAVREVRVVRIEQVED